MMDKFELKLCDIQGRLFANSAKEGYDSKEFVKAYMCSDVAKKMDSSYSRMHWAGEEYLLEEIADEASLQVGGKQYSQESLFWMGYIYRYWHFLTGDSSKKIVKIAPAAVMERNYLMFHTMDPEMAVEDLIAIGRGR